MNSPLASGTRLGRYEIRSQLGAGGMGEVYLAEDTSELRPKVAIKILPAEVAADRQRIQRLVQEVQTTSSLNHPNILTIFEIGEADYTRFIHGIKRRRIVARTNVAELEYFGVPCLVTGVACVRRET